MQFPREEAEEGGLGITPLVDVVLLLLIFFLVTTSFTEPRMALELPEAASGEASTEQPILTVTLGEDGSLRLGDEEVDLSGLATRLAELEVPEEEELELRAGDQVAHGRVVEVLDLARQAGIGRIGISVREPGSRTGSPAEAR